MGRVGERLRERRRKRKREREREREKREREREREREKERERERERERNAQTKKAKSENNLKSHMRNGAKHEKRGRSHNLLFQLRKARMWEGNTNFRSRQLDTFTIWFHLIREIKKDNNKKRI